MKRVYRYWTASEREFVRRHYGPLAPAPRPTAVIAALLRRPQELVRAAARRWGLCWREVGKVDRYALSAYLRGRLSDRVIAFRLGCARETVCRLRRKMRAT